MRRAGSYADSHANRMNLLLHLVAVPLFWLGSGNILAGIFFGDWQELAKAAAMIGISLALQGAGHRRELVQPEPFRGPFDFASRILAEQFLRFPAFLFSGLWWRNLQSARD